MAKFPPDDPKQRNAALIGAGLLLLLYPFNAFWYKGQREAVTEVAARIETLEDQNRVARVTAARGGADLEERMALYEKHVAALERLIPQSEEVPTLLNDMALKARQIGVELNSTVPEPPEPGSFYTKTSYDVSVIGDYHPVARFLTEVASLSRIVTPVDLDMAPYDQPDQFPEYEAPVMANFRIETYILPEPGSAPPSADAGTGGE